jgi:hypothetical protein
MPSQSACRAEIERLHQCFVEWFTGTAAAAEFDRIDGALGADFEMVTPEGDRRSRDAVLDSIREAHGREERRQFDIEIRNVDLRQQAGSTATVRYEEWQDRPAETTARISTALLREADSTPGGLMWLDLHETWLE